MQIEHSNLSHYEHLCTLTLINKLSLKNYRIMFLIFAIPSASLYPRSEMIQWNSDMLTNQDWIRTEISCVLKVILHTVKLSPVYYHSLHRIYKLSSTSAYSLPSV